MIEKPGRCAEEICSFDLRVVALGRLLTCEFALAGEFRKERQARIQV